MVIVDDEPQARDGIRIRLGDYPDVEVVGECSSGAEAVSLIKEYRPDLLFLDIQMPEMNGFEVLRRLGSEPMPVVIFVTAYDKYALKAFEYHALDYLLKPVGEERFREAVNAALAQVGKRNLEAYAFNLKKVVDDYLSHIGLNGQETISTGAAGKHRYLEHFAVKSHGNITMVPASEINWIEAAGDYVYIHTDTQKHLIREKITSLEKSLDPNKFVRIHRSTVVNVDMIKSMRSNEHGDYEVQLKSGDKLRMSRSFRESFQKVIGNSI